jgi:hypothetical protein
LLRLQYRTGDLSEYHQGTLWDQGLQHLASSSLERMKEIKCVCKVSIMSSSSRYLFFSMQIFNCGYSIHSWFWEE